MEAVDDGSLDLDAAVVSHLDGCLGCLACETACPSGVSFGERIESFRPRLRLGLVRTARRYFALKASASPALLRLGLATARALDASGLEHARRRLPGLGLLPRARAEDACRRLPPTLRSRIPAPIAPRATAALLTGCAADVVRPQVTRAAVEALHQNGIAVVDVSSPPCCGALALHAGRAGNALTLVRENSIAYSRVGVDFIVTTAAGCGAALKRYDRILASSDPQHENAVAVSRKARDVCQVLQLVGISAPDRPLRFDGPVAYHDACHLLNVGSVTSAPRAVVAAATGRSPVDLGENSICCGSAGSYNLEQPAMGNALGARKAELASDFEPAIIAVGNVGCMLQIERALARRRVRTPVVHPIELLAAAYRNST